MCGVQFACCRHNEPGLALVPWAILMVREGFKFFRLVASWKDHSLFSYLSNYMFEIVTFSTLGWWCYFLVNPSTSCN